MLSFAIFIGKLLLEDGYLCLFFYLLLEPLDSACLVGRNGELSVLVINDQVKSHIFNISTQYKLNIYINFYIPIYFYKVNQERIG
jgi:hypothetical protein